MLLRILAVLMGTSPHYTDAEELPSERLSRLAPVAQQVDALTLRATCQGPWAERECRPIWGGSRRELAAAALALGREETWWAAYVGAGNCEEGPAGSRCDPDSEGRPQARGYWQQWRAACPAIWATVPGSEEEVRAGVGCAIRLLVSAYHRCRARAADPWAGAFSGYAGASCTWDKGERRARIMRRILMRL